MKTLLVIGSCLLFTACATMFGDHADTISITSEPEGAEVYLRGELLGKTPLVTEISRRTEANFLTLTKQGYGDERVELQRKITGIAFLNFGYVLTTSGASSWGTDISTGRMWEYAPKKYVVKLDAEAAGLWNKSVFDFVNLIYITFI